MNRPPKEETFLHIAAELAQQSTCRRRAVGCVLVDEHWDILGTGYNGTARGQPHCLEEPCLGADRPSGTDLDLCLALHAEQNALLRCRDVWRIDTALVTCAPCLTCVKLLLNTACRRIVFVEPYAVEHSSAADLWTGSRSDRVWLRWPGELRTTVAPLQSRSEPLCSHHFKKDECHHVDCSHYHEDAVPF